MTSTAPLRVAERTTPSAAGPLAVGFGITVLSLALAIACFVGALRNDDWLIGLLLAVLGLLIGVVKLCEGIYNLVRTIERAVDPR